MQRFLLQHIRGVLMVCALSAMGLLPSTVGAYSYDGHHWDYGNPTYVDVTIQSSIPSSWISAISAAESAWNGTGAKFRFRAGYADHNVALKNLWWTSALAVTYIREGSSTRITDKDTDMNSRYSWDVNGDPNKYDVQSTMAHEFGHWLHLLDLYGSGDYGKTMYGIGYPGDTFQRTLEQDDINGIRAIYGT